MKNYSLFGRKYMKALVKLFIMESYHKFGYFSEEEKNDRGKSQIMPKESKLVNIC